MYRIPHNLKYGKNASLVERFMRLPQPANKVIAEYIWIGGNGGDLRSKSRILELEKIGSLGDLPDWAYDGSSTNQAEGKNSEVTLKPVRYCGDPFRGGNNILVMCETFDDKDQALPSNHRAYARRIFSDPRVCEAEPWYGLEQEYTLFTPDSLRPLGFPEMGQALPQGPYYCGVGNDTVFGRDITEAHFFAALSAGLTIGGTNAEGMPGQWEYQIGPVVGIDAADQLWLARYMMERLSEDFQVKVSLEPKPLKSDDWNGAGCHCNFSTAAMRAPGGISEIEAAIAKLEQRHLEHMEVYGEGNHYRMTGKNETSSYDRFSSGISNRNASVRVTHDTLNKGCGLFEDRRPAANCDPYSVTAKVAETTILDDKLILK